MAPWQLDEHFPWNASSSGFETKPLYLLRPTGRSLYIQQTCQQRDGSDGARPQGRGQQLQHANYRMGTSPHRTVSLLSKQPLKVRLVCDNFIAGLLATTLLPPCKKGPLSKFGDTQ